MKTKTGSLIVGAAVLIVLGTSIGRADLVGYWSFDNPADLGHDDSGNGHDGTTHGNTAPTEDRFGESGKAAYFDGDNDYIDLGDDPALTPENFSVAAWFRTSASGLWQTVYGLSYWAGDNPEYSLRVWHTDRLILKVRTNQVVGSTVVTDGEWHHVVATREGSLGKIFLDGEWEAESNSMSGIVYNSRNLPYFIGATYDTWYPIAAYDFQGSIDEVRVYNHALSEPEIQELAGTTIQATVDIDPDTLNLNSNGKWVTCYIELPEGCNVMDIDGATVKLEGIPAYLGKEGWARAGANSGNILDHDGDGIQERMVKFDGPAVRAYLRSLGMLGEIALTVTGDLVDGPSFEGWVVVRIIQGGK